MSNNEKPNFNITKILLFGLGFVGVVFCLGTGCFYAYFFSKHDSVIKTDTWGPFGDFYGGLLNPIIGLFALIGLLWTIYQNQRELNFTRLELSKSSEALINNNKIAKKQDERERIKEAKNDVFRMITLIYKEINQQLNLEIIITMNLYSKPGKETVETIKLKSLFCGHPLYKNRLPEIFSRLKENIVLNDVKDLLNQLEKYLKHFEDLSKNIIVTNFFKEYYIGVVEVLHNHAFLSPETLNFYSTKRQNKTKNISDLC